VIHFKLGYGFQVDLVEPVSHFLEAARENLTGCMDVEQDTHKAANFYCIPLQVGQHL
jgi:protein N-terminal methyltransferase